MSVGDAGGDPQPLKPASILARLLTVDGSGSGLDADLVRGVTPGTAGLTVLALATATLGDTLYASGANTFAKLAGNITAVKQFLTQTGTGTVSAAPAWAAIASADVPWSTPGTIGSVTPNTVKATTLTVTGLTSGRVVFSTTGGQLTDNSGFTWTTSVLSSSTRLLLTPAVITNSSSVHGIQLTHNTREDATAAVSAYGLAVNTAISVAAGVTNSGAHGSINTTAFRNTSNGTADEAGTLTDLFGYNTSFGHRNTNAVAPVTTTITGLYLQPFMQTGSCTDFYVLRIASLSAGGTINGTQYGLFIGTVNNGTTGSYAIWTGVGKCNFGDTTDATTSTAAGTIVGGGIAVAKAANIGTTLTVGTTAAVGTNLTVTGIAGIGGASNSQAIVYLGTANPLTGAVQVGALAGLVGTSAATTAIRGFQASLQTAAAAFTCTDLVGFLFGGVTQGAGSTITRIAGFSSTDSSSKSANTVGFYHGTSPAFTGHWALFIDGAFANYLGTSATLINTTTNDGASKLQVNGALALAAIAAPSLVAGQLWQDSTQNAIIAYTSGVKQTLAGIIFSSTADATVANTLTETSIIGAGVGTKTLPANFFVAGKSIRIIVRGYLSSTANPTLNIKVKYGSTVLVSSGAVAQIGTPSNKGFEVWVTVTCRTTGASGTVSAQGMWQYSTNAQDLVNTATTTIDTTASSALDITATWGTAAAGDTITGTTCIVEVLN